MTVTELARVIAGEQEWSDLQSCIARDTGAKQAAEKLISKYEAQAQRVLAALKH